MPDQKTIKDAIANLDNTLLPKFVSKEKLKKLKERETVLIPWLDLFICFYIPLPEETFSNSSASILMNESLLAGSGHTRDELLPMAVKNLSRQTIVMPFEKVMEELSQTHASLFPGESPCSLTGSIPIWFVSNKDKSYGAAVILCKETLKKLHKILGEAFLILPASVHEVLCLARQDEESENYYSWMVHEINEDCVSPEERLSDHIYLCRNGVIACAAEA